MAARDRLKQGGVGSRDGRWLAFDDQPDFHSAPLHLRYQPGITTARYSDEFFTGSFDTEALEEFARAANSQHWRNLTPTRFVESTALDSRSRSGDLSTGSMPSVSHAFGILSNDNRYCRARFRSQRLRLAAAKLLSVYRTRSSVGSDGILSRHRSVGYHHRNWHEYSSLLVLRN